MSRGVNKIIAVGNLGGDPEERFLPSGVAVCNFSMAVSESWKDKQSGEQQERTEWIRCEVWGKTAEACGKYLSKGSQVYIEGKLRTEKWNDKNTGEARYATKVRVDNVQFLGGGSDRSASSPQRENKPPQPEQQEVPDDDIPF